VPTLCTYGEGHTSGSDRREFPLRPRVVDDPRHAEKRMHENRETSAVPESSGSQAGPGRRKGRTPVMDAAEESDSGVVPMNQPNKVDPSSAAEVGEGRPEAKENSSSYRMPPTQSGKGMSQGWRGVREAARRDKKIRFTALLHHVTVPLLRECFCALQRQAAPGVDGVIWRQYEQDLENRLADLHGRIHRGTYRAQPS
jgi:RNA-directed DNA polymerase